MNCFGIDGIVLVILIGLAILFKRWLGSLPPDAKMRFALSKNSYVVILAVLSLDAIIAGLLSTNYLAYHSGAKNADFGFFFPIITYLALLLFGATFSIVGIIGGIACFRRWRWLQRVIWIAMLLLVICTGSAGFYSTGGHAGLEQYAYGFQHWTAENIDDRAIRKWLASRVPLPTPPPPATTIDPADWPKILADLHPREIHLCKSGVIITFGTFGVWGDQRQIFVAVNPKTGDPGIFLWGENWMDCDPSMPHSRSWVHSPWIEVKPGVYFWIQSGG